MTGWTFGFVFVTVVASCKVIEITEPPKLPEETLNRIIQLSEDRQSVAAAARRLVAKKSTTPPDKFQESVGLYEKAQGSWNAWLAALILGVKTGQALDGNAMTTKAEQASKETKDFVSQAKGLTGLGIGSSLLPVVGALREIVIGIAQDRNKLRDAQRAKLAEELSKLSWPQKLEEMASFAK